MALTSYELASTVLNFSGSFLSFLGSLFILLCYLFIPMKRHIRHFLILNLAISDFFNALNNSVSGMAVLINMRLLKMSVPCVINGFIGQFTVLATDFNILAIAVVTLVAIRSSRWKEMSDPKKIRYTLYICAAVWVIPLITALVALTQGFLGPVSGNWCWIKSEPAYVRYVLTHAWRLTFIAIEIVIYGYVYSYLKFGIVRRSWEASTPSVPATSSVSPHSAPLVLPMKPLIPTGPGYIHELSIDHRKATPHVLEMKRHVSGENLDEKAFPTHSATHPFTEVPFTPSGPGLYSVSQQVAERGISSEWKEKEAETSSDSPNTSLLRTNSVSRIMLLNAYPLAYIILWMPGVANRIAEATGHPSKVLRLMQASTQFVGFANGLTYGWNEKVAESLKEWWKSRK